MIETIHHYFETGCLYFGIGSLILIAAWMALRYPIACTWEIITKMWSRSKIQFFLMAVFVGAFIQYGATKGGRPNPQYGSSLTDDGSIVTNTYVHLKWTYTGHEPDDIVHIFYLPTNTPSATPQEIGQVEAGMYEWYLSFIGADTYYWIAQFSETPAPIDTKDEEAFVCQLYQHLPDSKPEEYIPVAVDITIDDNGIFDFIPRPPMPPDATNEVDGALMSSPNSGEE